MDSEDELCHVEGPGGMYCTMPKNHDGRGHAFEVYLPADVAQIISDHIDSMEEQRVRLAREIRRMRFARWGLLAALVVNVLAAVINLSTP